MKGECLHLCVCAFVSMWWWEMGVHDCWWMDESNGEKKRERERRWRRYRESKQGAVWSLVRMCDPGPGVVSAMRLWQPQFAVCLDSEAPPQEQLNNRWQERGSIHRAGHTETYTNTHTVMYAEICAWRPACFLSGLNEDAYKKKAGTSEKTFSEHNSRWVVWTSGFSN